MNSLSFVFVRFALVLILGILSGFFGEENTIFGWLFGLFSISYLLIFFSKKYTEFLGINAMLIIFCFGNLLVQQHQTLKNNTHFAHQNFEYYQAQLISDIKESKNTYSFTAQVYAVWTKNTWQNTTGKLHLEFYKDSISKDLFYGHKILVKGSPQKIQNLKNPNTFDREAYFAYQDIFYAQKLKKSHFQIIDKETPFWFIAKAYQTRHYLDKKMQFLFPTPQGYSIATALILGIKDHIDQSTREAYADAGIMHILAVSGLHVGIIYLIFSFFLKGLQQLKFGKVIYTLIIILLLFFYCFLTGFSASVLRASLMFSLFLVGKGLGRKGNSLNILGFSAFVLLCYEPLLCLQLGFQFSYLAVASILIFEPKIRRWYTPSQPVVLFFWQLVSVSLAAQILITPISIYYFHQFSLHFLLVNVLIIPLVGVLMWLILGGIGVAFFSDDLAKIVFRLADFMINSQEKFVVFANQIPYVILENIYPKSHEILIFYLVIGLIYGLFLTKKIGYFYALVCCTFLIFISQMQTYFSQEKQHQLHIWHLPKHKALSLHHKNSAILLADTSLTKANKEFYFKNFFASKNIGKWQEFYFGQANKNLAWQNFEAYDLWVYQQKSFLFLHQKSPNLLPQTDYLVVSHNALDWKNINALSKQKIIFDGTNSSYFLEKIAPKMDSLGLDYHFTERDGFFLLDFEESESN